MTIPGAVHAWCSMHEKYGKLDLEQILEGAERYRKMVFQFMKLATCFKDKQDKLKKNENSKKLFLNDNKCYKFGEVLKISH